MALKQISNTTAKQVIDASRAYRELIRTRRSLQKLGGSMFWKISGSHAYLVQRSCFDSRKVQHLGIKSSQTAARLQAYEAERARLQQREATLQERIWVFERMNKAVRAGVVANSVIDATRLFDRIGISEDCIWIGSPAQHVYWQSSGFETPKLLGDGEDLGEHLVFVKRKMDATSLNKLHRCKALTLDVVRGEHSTLLLIKLNATAHSGVGPGLAGAIAQRQYSKFIKDTVHEYMDLIFDASVQSPFFEQVLISKTGRMGMLKTVTPNFFAAWNTLFGLDIGEMDLFQQLLESGRLVGKSD